MSTFLAILADTVTFVDNDNEFDEIYEQDEMINRLLEPTRRTIPRPPLLSDIYTNSHSVWFVRVMLILIAILHTCYHLPF